MVQVDDDGMVSNASEQRRKVNTTRSDDDARIDEGNTYETTDEFRRIQEESRRLLKEFESGEQTYRQLDESIRQRYIRCIQQALESGRNSNSYDFRLLKSNKNSEFNITNNIQPSLFHDAFEIIKPCY